MDKERKFEIIFLTCIYLLGLTIRIYPKLMVSPHLPSFLGDVWYRICMAQYILDHGRLPIPDIRYLAYGNVPLWYPPLSPLFLAFLSKITTLDLPTVCTRVVPFFEAFTPIPFYFLVKKWYNGQIARISVLILALTPSFIYLTGIADLQIFTLWILPVALIIISEDYTIKRAIILGILLGINFLFHLSYFVTLVTLLIYILAEKIEKRPIKEKIKFFLIATGVSLGITAWWWAPDNLFKWWIFHISTSTLLQGITGHLEFYGAPFMILGFIGFAYFCIKKFNYKTFIVLWCIFLFYEVFSENILDILNKQGLMWETVVRPLEGYRFYIFLAMPFSLVSALFLDNIRKDLDREVLELAIISAMLVISLTGLSSYNIEWKLTNAGVNEREYKAALWFRENTDEDARIVADYYTAQMFAGVCGGKALLGGLFPLRNIDFNPYIKAPGQVQDDIYDFYSTDDIDLTFEIAKRYGITHVFISRNMETSGWLGAYKAGGFGVPVNHGKFENDKYFKLVYSDGDIEIYKILYDHETS